MEYSQKIKVDIRDHQTYEQLYAKQCDKGYPLIFEITKDKESFDLSGVTAKLQMTKPDGNIILENCSISNNEVQVILTEQMTAIPGKNYFEIALYDGNSQRITTITGIMKVDKSAVQSTTVSESVLNVIIQSVEEAQQYASNALESANNAETSANESADSATLSRSWAVGDTSTRAGESTNNSRYYSEQSSISATHSKTSEDNAKASELASKTSETNAKTSEDNAKDSEIAAKTSEDNAKDSEIASKTSEDNAKDSETNAKNSEDNAKISETNAKDSEDNAKDSEGAAKISEINAKTSEDSASASATSASTSASNAATSESNASTSASNAATSESNALSYKNDAYSSKESALTSATNAATSESNAFTYSKASQSYAVGTGNYRPGESSDNAKYYYEQAKAISESLGGTLIPMGTITFSQLPSVQKLPGYMYNISNEFTTTSDFKEGSGITMPAGTNVYYTADEMWDCLAGSPVTGIKGDNETSYRRGNVNITKADIGLGNVANKLSQAEIVSDTEPTNQAVGDFWMREYT